MKTDIEVAYTKWNFQRTNVFKSTEINLGLIFINILVQFKIEFYKMNTLW